MGRAGLTVLGYHWMPGHVSRTSTTRRGRGGAKVTAYDHELLRHTPVLHGRVYSDDEMWDAYAHFVREVVPVAESSGVRLALHPDDPPLPELGGTPRLFHGPEGFRRAMALAGASPASGLDFCLGNWYATGCDISEAIAEFGRRGQIVYGHVQAVVGTVPSFHEGFVDEAGCDFQNVFASLDRSGVDGVFAPAHLPHTIDEKEPPHVDPQYAGNAYAFGYLTGLLRALRNAEEVPK